ncbi:MAG: sulfate permease [Acidobacteria bacterium]|nr:sulfate permease [Acidobacteriota bacterium]
MSHPLSTPRWWLLDYRRADLPADLLAGAVVAVLLVPQSMAYALLAGLPPQMGLYASVVPVTLYGLFGKGRSLSVAPTAITALLVGSSLARLTPAGSADTLAWAVVLAFLVGVIQLALGLLRAGFLANLLGHSVISGFTSAAALVIAANQLPPLLGIHREPGSSFAERVSNLLADAAETDLATLALGVGAILLLLVFPKIVHRSLRPLPEVLRSALARGGPLAAVALGSLAVTRLDLDSVAVVGAIPAGLPVPSLPALSFEAVRALLPSALAISLISFVESFAISKALASRHRERVEPDAVLRGLGTANLGASLTGAFPVSGGLGRSMVNDQAGARSGVASVTAAALVALTLVALTPAFRSLPRAVLAAIIVVAVSRLFEPNAFRRLWRYSKSDALAWAVTFVAVLVVGVEHGVLTGVVAAVALHLARTSRPHIAVVGRLGNGEHFRNVLRHPVRTWPKLLLVRIDESLYFANAAYLEGRVLEMVARRPEVEHLVLIASAVNLIDGGALESLDRLITGLRQAGVTLHLAEVKGPVMDRLKRSDLLAKLAPGRVFLSTHNAVEALAPDGEA